jgi:hypothetical protein
MAMINEQPRDRTVVVGLLADPGLPAQIAQRMADDLPGVLAQRVSSNVLWKLQTQAESLAVDEHGEVQLVEHALKRFRREAWDLMVYLTDLPQRIGTRPVVTEVCARHHTGLVSIPAIGWIRVQEHTLDAVAHLVREIAPADIRRTSNGLRATLPERAAPLTSHGDRAGGAKSDETFLSLPGVRGRARLLAGMVRANRPWQLVPSLATAIAAAAATAAFPIFYSSIWGMADALSFPRLAIINLFAVAVMVTWIILYNRLWERPRLRPAREQAVLYNASTLITVFLGVACMYVVLFVVTLLAASTVIPASYMQAQLGHPVSSADYLTLAWLASSMGTVAGALGSSLESEEAVRQATYSKREQERRARHREPTRNAPGR